jgi:ABC-type transporter Mla subunit MlaD
MRLREEFKAGLLIIIAILILTVSIVLIGGSRFFDKFDTYNVKVKNSAGLETGAQVRLGGVRVGRILDIREPAGPGESVTIEVGLKQGTRLYKGTKAFITQIGFVGDIYLLLAVNETRNELIQVGSIIPSEDPVEFNILMAKVDAISSSVDTLINNMNKVLSDKNIHEMEKLFENVNKVSVTVNATMTKLNTVLTEVEGLVKDNKGEVTLLIKQARTDLQKAEELLKSLDKTAKSVDKTVNIQSQNLDTLLRSMHRTTEDLQDVLQELKNKPWSIIYKQDGGKEE